MDEVLGESNTSRDTDEDDDGGDGDTTDEESGGPVKVGFYPRVAQLGMPSEPFFGSARRIPPGQELKVCDRFVPPRPTNVPQDLFNHDEGFLRFSRRVGGKDEMLLYADGACLDNGRPNARGGCGFVFRPADPSEPIGHDYVNFRLETKGPTGAVFNQTNNRAELRAIISALNFRAWHGEGWDRLVVATDSAYAVDGITNHMKPWLRRNWRTAKGTEVMNRDLWEELLARLRKFQTYGFEVQFWHIPRELNSKADFAAKDAAKEGSRETYYNIPGVLC